MSTVTLTTILSGDNPAVFGVLGCPHCSNNDQPTNRSQITVIGYIQGETRRNEALVNNDYASIVLRILGSHKN